MKKIALIALALVTVSTAAWAQRRDDRRDRRDRVTCTINTGKNQFYGQGRGCSEAVELARQSCRRFVKQKNQSRCDNAGMYRTSRYKVTCSEMRSGYRVNCTPY